MPCFSRQGCRRTCRLSLPRLGCSVRSRLSAAPGRAGLVCKGVGVAAAGLEPGMVAWGVPVAALAVSGSQVLVVAGAGLLTP